MAADLQETYLRQLLEAHARELWVLIVYALVLGFSAHSPAQCSWERPRTGGFLTQPGGRPVPGARALEGLPVSTPSGRWNSFRRKVDWCHKASPGTRATARD
jgi:hypothetical protein